MSCVESCRHLGERERHDSVSLCARVFAFSSLIFHGLSFHSGVVCSLLFSFCLSLFSIELPLVHSLVVIVVKKEGKRNKRNLLCHKNVHLQCSLCLCLLPQELIDDFIEGSLLVSRSSDDVLVIRRDVTAEYGGCLL